MVERDGSGIAHALRTSLAVVDVCGWPVDVLIPGWSTRWCRTRSWRYGGKPESYRGSGEVAAWIWGIGIRRLIDAFRRRGRDRSVLHGSRHGDSERSYQPEGAGTVDRSAEEEALLSVEYGDLAGALNRLSPELRTVMQATVLDGLTTKEAAHLLGIPRGTVKTRMMRARIQLKEELA